MRSSSSFSVVGLALAWHWRGIGVVLKLVKVLLVCFGELAVILGFFVFTGVHVSVRGLFQAGLLTGCGRKSQFSRDF